MNKKPQSSTRRIRNSIDEILAFSGIAISTIGIIISLILEFYYALGLSITIITISSIYLFNGSKFTLDKQDNTADYYKGNYKNSLLVSSLLIVILSIAAIFFSANTNYRPLWVFFALSLIPTIIFVVSVTNGDNPLFKDAIRSLTIVFTITLIICGVYVFPNNGSDTWRHIFNAEVIGKAGNLNNVEGVYNNFPIYPFFIDLLSSFYNISLADSARMLNVIGGVVFVLLIYSVSDKLNIPSDRSEIAVLLLLGSKWFIYWTYHVVSMTFAMLYFGLFFILILTAFNKRITNSSLLIVIILAIFTPFVHPVISGGTIIFLLFLWIVTFADKILFKIEAMGVNIAIILLIFSIFLLTQWMYFGQQIFDQIVPNILKPIFYEENPLSLSISYRDPIGYTLDQLAFFPVLAFGYFEVLRQTKIQNSQIDLYSGLIGILFVIFGYLTQVANLVNLLPHRWLFIATIVLILPASKAFCILFPLNKKYGRISATVFVFLLFFSAFVSTEANQDHPIYNVETTKRLGVTASEKNGFMVLSKLIELRGTKIRFDFQVWDYLHGEYSGKQYSNINYWKEMELDNYEGVFSIREVQFERPEAYNMPFDEIPDNDPNISLFYDSGDFWLLEKAKMVDSPGNNQ